MKQTGRTIKLPAGTEIFGPLDVVRHFYRLDSGRVRLSSGPGAILAQLGPGAFFGEGAFLTPPNRKVTAVALSPVVATVYGKRELLRLVQSDLNFTGRLLRGLALRLNAYELAISDFVTHSAEARLALLISRFAHSSSAKSGWMRLSLQFSNGELARMIGTTKWRVSHFLNRFQRLGWLERRPDGIWVDCKRLRDFIVSLHEPPGEE